MTIEKKEEKIVWTNFFIKREYPIGKDDAYMFSPVDKLIYIENMDPNTRIVTIQAVNLSGVLEDKRTYRVTFQKFFLQDGFVYMMYYDYNMNAWVTGRFTRSAGITAVTRV